MVELDRRAGCAPENAGFPAHIATVAHQRASPILEGEREVLLPEVGYPRTAAGELQWEDGGMM